MPEFVSGLVSADLSPALRLVFFTTLDLHRSSLANAPNCRLQKYELYWAPSIARLISTIRVTIRLFLMSGGYNQSSFIVFKNREKNNKSFVSTVASI